MQALSVIITTYNESTNIREAMASVKWADEIIVVDSYSTDGTPDIAEKLGATVYERSYSGPADQKNWAIPKAKHEWVLLLDADERLPEKLTREIQSVLENPDTPYDCFWIPRQNFFLGRKVNYSGWGGDAVVRLIRRDVCRYDEKQVHEEIVTEGLRSGKLKNKLLHYTFKDSGQYLDKIRRYGEWSALDHFEKTPRVTYYHLFVKPLYRFFKHFVIQRGFLDGRVGFIVSTIMAWGVFLRYLRIMELRRRDQVDDDMMI
jgi:glycosyltransferase involved in cell wall biosynthesis